MSATALTDRPRPGAPGRARAAATVAFATNGAITATLLARYAEVKSALGVSDGVFGLLVTGFMIGAACALGVPGMLMRRFGSRVVTSLGTATMAAAMLLGSAGIAAGSPWLFVAGLLIAGFADANVDVAQNAQGLRVQEAHGRSLLSSMHAGWSIGAATGGAVGTLAASAGVPLPVHLAVWGALSTLAMVIASRFFLPDRPADGPASASAPADAHEPALAPADGVTGPGDAATASTTTPAGRPPAAPGRRGAAAMLAPLALIALAGIAVEDVGSNWSAVFLHAEQGLAPQSAGIGLSVLLAVQFLGRLAGDRFIDAVGRRRAVIASLALVILGLVAFAWAPSAALSIAGLALGGLGCAITVPLAFSSADALPGLPPHAGVTWINSLMRITTLTLTPLIGLLATVSSLPLAITLIASIAVVALAFQLLGGMRERRAAV